MIHYDWKAVGMGGIVLCFGRWERPTGLVMSGTASLVQLSVDYLRIFRHGHPRDRMETMKAIFSVVLNNPNFDTFSLLQFGR